MEQNWSRSSESERSLLFNRRSNSTVRKKYRTYKCISSEAGLATLLWGFTVSLAYGLIYQPGNFEFLLPGYLIIVVHGCNAVILCFYPIAGFLADNRFGRYKVIVKSMHSLLVLLVIGATILLILIPLTLFFDTVFVTLFVFAAMMLVPVTGSFIMFNANIIQFGMDQLHDAPSDQLSIFIHWYIWCFYLAIFISQLAWKVTFFDYNEYFEDNLHLSIGIGLFVVISLSVLILLGVSACIARSRNKWFLVDSARLNPYRLVYNVTKFAQKHTSPVQRSAFTYC